jgi:hypothetical protein
MSFKKLREVNIADELPLIAVHPFHPVALAYVRGVNGA